MTDLEKDVKSPRYRVDVLEKDARARRGAVRCEVGKSKNLVFTTEGLETYLFAPWQSVVFDALLLAAAVEFCDRGFPRPRLAWRREFSVSLPVHDVDRCKSPSVYDSLVGALSLLTGDAWDFQFRGRTHDEPPRRWARLPLPTGTKAVLPYRDGLDSWAAATIAERSLGPGLLRVRLGPKAAGLRSGHPRQPFSRVPFNVRSAGHPLRQTVVRSRGFKFALISGIAAYLADAAVVMIPESGQGCLGSDLVRLGHAYPDYRSHPRFAAKMQTFIAALFGHQVSFDFPHLWNTKGATLRQAIAEPPVTRAWTDTRSCWQNQRWVSVNGKFRQCGICSACMLRRLSVHAADQEEPNDTYVWENLSAPAFQAGATPLSRQNKMFQKHAIAGTSHMDHLAGLMKSPGIEVTLDRHALVLSRVLQKPTSTIVYQLTQLLQQHAREWSSYVTSLGPDSFVAQWAHSLP